MGEGGGGGAASRIRKAVGESRRTKRGDAERSLPDLSAFMNDRFFFGDTVNYPQLHTDRDHEEEEEEEEVLEEEQVEEIETPKINKSIYGKNNGANRSRRTQEWLEEARLIVSSSPARRSADTTRPSSLSLSLSVSSSPAPAGPPILKHEVRLSRSTRHSNEILEEHAPPTPTPSHHVLSKNNRLSASARLDSDHSSLPTSRFNSGIITATSHSNAEKEKNKKEAQAAGVQQWLANIMKKGGASHAHEVGCNNAITTENVDATRHSRPPRQPRHNSDSTPNTLKDVLRSTMRNNNEVSEGGGGGGGGAKRAGLLSPPRRSVQVQHARHSSSPTPSSSANSATPRGIGGRKYEEEDVSRLNNFLKKQRSRVTLATATSTSTSGRVKLILSAPVSSTSSMVAAICYAWLLAERGEEEEEEEEEAEAVPVINIKRTQMRGHRQAAWLFHHLGIDARSLLFADEVDMKSLAHVCKLNIIVIGQDTLNTNTHDNVNDGVVSPCTLLVDEYYKQAYDLLEAPYLRKFLLAGIILDTKNLAGHIKRREAQAIDLLLVNTSPNHKNNLLNLLNQKHTEDAFEEVIQSNYGDPITSGKLQASFASSSNGKNIISQTLSKWFGFGSK